MRHANGCVTRADASRERMRHAKLATRASVRGRGHLRVLALAGLTRAHTDFDFVAPHLTQVRLIRPDYRGRGASAWTGAATYTVPQEAADVLALMDHLGLERVAILGTSRGGLIALALAAMVTPSLLLEDAAPAPWRPPPRLA